MGDKPMTVREHRHIWSPKDSAGWQTCDCGVTKKGRARHFVPRPSPRASAIINPHRNEQQLKANRQSDKSNSLKVKLNRIITEMESKLESERDSCPFCMMFREEGVSDYHLGSCEISLLWEVANDL
jgi:hypothetical protein